MPLPDNIELLCIAIGKKASIKKDEILKKAKEKAQLILSKGLKEVEREIEAKKRLLKSQAFQEARKKTDGAELAARRLIMASREEIFEKAMEKAKKTLYETKRDQRKYMEMLKAMIKRGLSAVSAHEAETIIIKCASEDYPVLEDAAKEVETETKTKIHISKNWAEIGGGLILFSEDMRRMVDFSFEALFKRLEPGIRNLVAQKIFR